MRQRVLWVACVVAACSKGGPAQQTAAPVPKPEPVAAAPAPAAPAQPPAPADTGEMSITSKSPEAVAHFKQGRDLLDNLRTAESVEHFKKAVELDPDFALATSYLGGVTPGKEGFALIDRSVGLAKNVPEPERNFIGARQATAQGDRQKATSLLQKVVDARPKEWRAQLLIGQLAFDDENWDLAVSASQKALEAGPQNPQPYNYVAYGYAWQGRYDDAIAAAKKQVELLPGEPNPQDTLGEILMAAGKLDDALAAFQKAIELSPKFTESQIAAAEIHMYKGDWKGGYQSLKKAHDSAPRPQEAFNAAYAEMWALAGQGKAAEALKIGEQVEKAAQENKLAGAYAFAPLMRAQISALSGKPANAEKLVAAGYARAKEGELPPPVMRNVTMTGETARLVAAWKMKKPAAAEKAYAALEAAAKQGTPSRGDQSLLDFAQGIVAWSKGNAKGAVESMKKCSQLDYVCSFVRAQAQRAAGDKKGAAATLASLKASPRRDYGYLYFWSAAK